MSPVLLHSDGRAPAVVIGQPDRIIMQLQLKKKNKKKVFLLITIAAFTLIYMRVFSFCILLCHLPVSQSIWRG